MVSGKKMPAHGMASRDVGSKAPITEPIANPVRTLIQSQGVNVMAINASVLNVFFIASIG